MDVNDGVDQRRGAITPSLHTITDESKETPLEAPEDVHISYSDSQPPEHVRYRLSSDRAGGIRQAQPYSHEPHPAALQMSVSRENPIYHAPTNALSVLNSWPSPIWHNTAEASSAQVYLLTVCRAMISCGAPSHRLEVYMQLSADALGFKLQSFYLPGCMFISFGNDFRSSAGVHLVRASQALDLSRLSDVHAVYKDVIHHRITPEDGTARLDEICTGHSRFPVWGRVLSYGLASAFIGPVSYSSHPLDLPIIFVMGSLFGFLELSVAPKSELYGYVFEITVAILAAFAGRGFGSIRFHNRLGFCFSAISQASIVMILPGFTITSSALELQSKNIVSGAVRMVYGIIYIMFLAFGFTVGATIYGAIDDGATSATTCGTTPQIWLQIIFVILFTICYIIVNQAKWKQMPAMVIVTLAGWLVNHYSTSYFSSVLAIGNALGALTVGILANLCSRFRLGVAVAIMQPAIFIQVPGSLGATGSLLTAVSSANELVQQAKNGTFGSNGSSIAPAGAAVLQAGYAMVEIAIGITVGLSISALLVYPFRKKKGRSGLFAL